MKRYVDLSVDRVAAQAVGRDCLVTGSPQCYRLAVVRELRVCRESGRSRQSGYRKSNV